MRKPICRRCRDFYSKYPLEKNPHPSGTGPEYLHHVDGCYYSGPIECAFDEDGKFNTDNWSCQTMIRLRELCGEDDRDLHGDRYWYRDDMQNGTIGVMPLPEWDGPRGYLVLTLYKSRGRTESANIVSDNGVDSVLPLDLKTAETLADFYQEHNDDSRN